MTRLSYPLKCWALSIAFYTVFYFGILTSDPSFSKYIYILGISTLLFPISKRVIDVIGDSLAPNVVLFNGLLPSLLLNIVIWIFTPFIAIFALIAFSFYSLNILKKNLVG